MSQPQTIKKFIFNAAQYYLSDGEGDLVLLKIDYHNNHYAVEDHGQAPNPRFRREIDQVAANLLARKHAANFAGRLQI